MNSYLKFIEIKDTGKTKVWQIRSTATDSPLGQILWFAPWRRYCLNTYTCTMWDTNCLSEIVRFIDDEMEKRK